MSPVLLPHNDPYELSTPILLITLWERKQRLAPKRLNIRTSLLYLDNIYLRILCGSWVLGWGQNFGAISLIFYTLTVVCGAVSFITPFNPLSAELNPFCHLLALFGALHIIHVSRVRVKLSYNMLDFNLTVQLKVKWKWRYPSTPNTLSRRVQG